MKYLLMEPVREFVENRSNDIPTIISLLSNIKPVMTITSMPAAATLAEPVAYPQEQKKQDQ